MIIYSILKNQNCDKQSTLYLEESKRKLSSETKITNRNQKKKKQRKKRNLERNCMAQSKFMATPLDKSSMK